VRKNVALIAGWVGGTIVGVLLAMQGVTVVADSLSGDSGDSRTPSELARELSEPDADGTVPSPETSRRTSTTAGTGTTDAGGGTGTTGSGRTGTTSGSAGAAATNAPPATPASQTTPAPPGPSPQPQTQPQTQPQPQGFDQKFRFQTQGGTVTVHYHDGVVTFLSASPASGFSLDKKTEGGEVDVRFQSDDHESRLRAVWADQGHPDIEEKDTGNSGSG
jgi:hypothetical protein